MEDILDIVDSIKLYRASSDGIYYAEVSLIDYNHILYLEDESYSFLLSRIKALL